MKTNKTLLLTLALTAACVAQPTYGMNLQTAREVLNKAQKHWKPIAGTLAVVGIGYWLWSTYNQPEQNSLDFLENGEFIYLNNIDDTIVETLTTDTQESKLAHSEVIPVPVEKITEANEIKQSYNTVPSLMFNLNFLAKSLNKENLDKQEMREIYKSVDQLYENAGKLAQTKLLLYNNKQLLKDSQNKKSLLRHLSITITQWYKNAGLYK